jgi:hypothetical protein
MTLWDTKDATIQDCETQQHGQDCVYNAVKIEIRRWCTFVLNQVFKTKSWGIVRGLPKCMDGAGLAA